MNNWQTVLTSAAVGVLVSSLVNLLGQYLERRSRQDEMLFQKALELAIAQRDFRVALADNAGTTATLVNAETNLRYLKSLMNTGKLPSDAFNEKH